jgi:hypothetical protein
MGVILPEMRVGGRWQVRGELVGTCPRGEGRNSGELKRGGAGIGGLGDGRWFPTDGRDHGRGEEWSEEEWRNEWVFTMLINMIKVLYMIMVDQVDGEGGRGSKWGFMMNRNSSGRPRWSRRPFL